MLLTDFGPYRIIFLTVLTTLHFLSFLTGSLLEQAIDK
jgi:hypothetical protein